MDWFVDNAGAWQASGTWATFIVLAVTLIYIAGQTRATRQLTRREARPYIVVAIDPRQRILLTLTVENVGRTPARDVLLRFDKQPQSTLKDFQNITMLTEGLPTVPPGRTFQAYWESALTVFDDKKPYPYPTRYDVTVQYRDTEGRKYADDYILDFNQFYGLAQAERGVHEVAEELEKIRQEQERWRAPGNGGLQTYNIDGDRRDHLRDREYLLRSVLPRLRRKLGWRGVLKEVLRFYLVRRWLPVPRWLSSR